MPPEARIDQETVGDSRSPQNGSHTCPEEQQLLLANTSQDGSRSGQERVLVEGALSVGGQLRLGEHSDSSPNSHKFHQDQQLTEQERGSEGGDAGHPSMVGNFYQLMTLQERS